MYERIEHEYYTAKRKAAARLGVNPRGHVQNLPSNPEIREEIQTFARIHEGESRLQGLAEMRLAALHLMRRLAAFQPRLIGSVLTGHVRSGSDIDLHVFSYNAAAITEILDAEGYRYDVERKRVLKHGDERIFTHIHVQDRYDYELTIYTPEQVRYPFKSSISGKVMERASLAELEALIEREHPGVDDTLGFDETEPSDPYVLWPLLLAPLADVQQDPRWHPEGDALYHSLQAFELARDARPFDSELIAAALLHDVGKAIDPADHVAAGLEALEGTLTGRAHFLIEHHMEAQALLAGELGARRTVRLRSSECFEDLLLLREIDNRARVRGAAVCTVDEALAYLRRLDAEDFPF